MTADTRAAMAAADMRYEAERLTFSDCACRKCTKDRQALIVAQAAVAILTRQVEGANDHIREYERHVEQLDDRIGEERARATAAEERVRRLEESGADHLWKIRELKQALARRGLNEHGFTKEEVDAALDAAIAALEALNPARTEREAMSVLLLCDLCIWGLLIILCFLDGQFTGVVAGLICACIRIMNEPRTEHSTADKGEA